MMNQTNSISVVIPVYKSENIIENLYSELKKELEGLKLDYEVILVNDCSPDGVLEKIQNISKKDKTIKLLSLRKNVGYDNALMAGLHEAKNAFIVIMDDDLQHSPSDIKTLLNKIIEGHDVVYASFIKKKQNIIKNFGSWLNGKMAQVVINKPTDIYLSPYKILRKEIVDEIKKYGGPFPYIDGLIFQVTRSITQVVVEHQKRAEGKGNHGMYRSLKILFNFCTTFSILPLRIATLAGLSVSICAVFLGLFLVFFKLFYGINVEGWTSIVLAIIVMGGAQLMALGILGEYVGRTYMNINQRPQYVIKEKVN